MNETRIIDGSHDDRGQTKIDEAIQHYFGIAVLASTRRPG